MVKSAISGLRPRARNVVELIHFQEHLIGETAHILGISTGAVKTRMFHAKIALHRMPGKVSAAPIVPVKLSKEVSQ